MEVSKLLRRSRLPALGVAAAMLAGPSSLRAQDPNSNSRIADPQAHEEQLIRNEAYRNKFIKDFEKRIVTDPNFDLKYRKYRADEAAEAKRNLAKAQAELKAYKEYAAAKADLESNKEKSKLAEQELAPLLKLSGAAYAKEFRTLAPALLKKYGEAAIIPLNDSLDAAIESKRVTEALGEGQLGKELHTLTKPVVRTTQTKPATPEESLGRLLAQQKALQPAK